MGLLMLLQVGGSTGGSVALGILLVTIVLLPLMFLLFEGLQQRRGFHKEMEAVLRELVAGQQGVVQATKPVPGVAAEAEPVEVRELSSKAFRPAFGPEEPPERFGYVPSRRRLTGDVQYVGPLQVGSATRIDGSVSCTESLAMQSQAKITRDVIAGNNLYMGPSTTIEGQARVQGDVHMASGSHIASLSCTGDVFMEEGAHLGILHRGRRRGTPPALQRPASSVPLPAAPPPTEATATPTGSSGTPRHDTADRHDTPDPIPGGEASATSPPEAPRPDVSSAPAPSHDAPSAPTTQPAPSDAEAAPRAAQDAPAPEPQPAQPQASAGAEPPVRQAEGPQTDGGPSPSQASRTGETDDSQGPASEPRSRRRGLADRLRE